MILMQMHWQVVFLSDQELCLIAGTWSINEYLSKEAPREIEKKKNTVTLSYMKDYYIMEDSTPTSASNLNWYLNHFVRPEKQELSADEIYIVCNKQVESVKPEECKVIFVPYLFGSATHENAHGAFLILPVVTIKVLCFVRYMKELHSQVCTMYII